MKRHPPIKVVYSGVDWRKVAEASPNDPAIQAIAALGLKLQGERKTHHHLRPWERRR